MLRFSTETLILPIGNRMSNITVKFKQMTNWHQAKNGLHHDLAQPNTIHACITAAARNAINDKCTAINLLNNLGKWLE